MAKACLDTNVLIELSRQKLIKYVSLEDNLCIPWIVAYEYVRGLAYIGRDPVIVKRELEKRFRILYPSNNILLRAAKIYVDLRGRGLIIPDPDILIAATCIEHGIPLSTSNVSHFSRIKDLELLSPNNIIEEYELLRHSTSQA